MLALLLLAPARADDAVPEAHPTLDLMLGITHAQLRDFPIAFDGTVGWWAPRWGIEAGGSRSYIELRHDGLIDRTVRWSYGAAVRGAVGPVDGPAWLDLRGELAYEDYKDGFLTLRSDARAFDNDDFLVASAQAGLGWDVPRLDGALTAGVAYSRDAYHSFAVDEDGQDVLDTSDVRRGLRAVARLTARHETVPSWIDTRLLVTFARYRREQILHDGVAAPDEWIVRETRELLLRTRLAADAVPLAFTGLVPGLFAGLDVLSADRAGTSATWVLGAALANRR